MDPSPTWPDEEPGHYQRGYEIDRAEACRVVAKLVSTRVEEGGVEELGGEAAVADFFASVKVILSRPSKTEC
jgi:hypothetical protein